jgi:hypothetical protein
VALTYRTVLDKGERVNAAVALAVAGHVFQVPWIVPVTAAVTWFVCTFSVRLVKVTVRRRR